LALAAATVWEVRTTGSDNSGGGFVAGASGTDLSQSDAAAYSGTDLAVDATTNTKVTSAGHSFVAADVGNLLNISAGASWTTGFYQIVSVAAGAATLDRSPAAVGVTGGTYAVGGALATLGKLAGAMVASNKAFVKAGTGYAVTSTPNFTQAVTPAPTAPFSRLVGYTTTRGDGGRATITLSTNAGLFGLRFTGAGWQAENFSIDCASLGSSTGVLLQGGDCVARNVKVANFTAYGFECEGSPEHVLDCEVTGGTSAATAGVFFNSVTGEAVRCWVHDNACTGISGGSSVHRVSWNLVTNNSGASSDGIRWSQLSSIVTGVTHNTVHGSGRHGLNNVGTGPPTDVRDNLLTSNGGFGFVGASAAGLPAHPFYDGNAYWNNTSGARSNCDDTTANPQDGVAPYANVLDVTLTGNPYTNSAGGDFTLNNTAGAGAACRAAGTPGALPGVTQTGKLDLGVFQHADAGGGGGGGLLTGPGMAGGMRG
jgi:hypothetical protein